MKTLLLISSLLFTFTSSYANPSKEIVQILNDSDKNEILTLIDRVCADSWCAGDYDYKFKTFSCNEQSLNCTLGFSIIDRDDHNKKPRNKRCLFKGISSKDMLLTGHNLNEEFYDHLNICITDRENK